MPKGVVTNPGGKGGFAKGRSGNPGGRPKADVWQLIDKATKGGQEIIDTMHRLMRGSGPEGWQGTVRAGDIEKAAEWMGSHYFGLPRQAVDVAGEEGGPIQVQVNVLPKEEP